MPTWFDRLVGLKRWGTNATLDEPTNLEADTGFEFLGQATPTAGLHDALFQYLDDKDNWLYRHFKSIADRAGLTFVDNNYNTLRDALARLFGGNRNVYTGGTATLTLDASGLVVINASSNITLTLPTAAGMANAPFFINIFRKDVTANVVTLLPASGQTIDGAASLVVRRGERFTLFNDGVNVWVKSEWRHERGKERFTSTTTWVCPRGVYRVRYRIWGGGGGGGGSRSSPAATISAGASGGGAGYTEGEAAVTPGASYALTVGQGGTGGAGSLTDTLPANGGNGGTSSFGAFATATGGQGGRAGNNTTALTVVPLGGTGSGGALNRSGDIGGFSIRYSTEGNEVIQCAIGGASAYGGSGRAENGAANIVMNGSTSACNWGTGGNGGANGGNGGNGANGFIELEY